MKTISVNEISFSVPSTASEWELYTHKHGADLAANQLTQALLQAIIAPSHKDAFNIMKNALENNAQYGAKNTEPKYIAQQYLQKTRYNNFFFVF